MSYDIFIGEAEDITEDGQTFLTVKRVEHPDAPVDDTPDRFGFRDISGKTNGRHPGYSQFHDWCGQVGLLELWYGENHRQTSRGGLLLSHPGRVPLTARHLDAVHKALKRHPKDFRLQWYAFWMKWALENCKNPAVANS